MEIDYWSFKDLQKRWQVRKWSPKMYTYNPSNTACVCFTVIRLLDMGFEAKVAQIIQSIDQQTTSRQTVLLSATLTEGNLNCSTFNDSCLDPLVDSVLSSLRIRQSGFLCQIRPHYACL